MTFRNLTISSPTLQCYFDFSFCNNKILAMALRRPILRILKSQRTLQCVSRVQGLSTQERDASRDKSKQTHFGFQTVGEEEKWKKGLQNTSYLCKGIKPQRYYLHVMFCLIQWSYKIDTRCESLYLWIMQIKMLLVI